MPRQIAICMVLIAGIFMSVSSAHAQTTFIFTASGAGGLSIDLTLTGTLDTGPTNGLASSVYYITGETGKVNGLTATLDPTSGPGVVMYDGALSWDNLLSFPGGTEPFNDNGLLLLVNGSYVNLAFVSGVEQYFLSPDKESISEQEPITFDLTETPEAASILLFGTGLLAIGFFMRKKIFA